MAVKDQDIEILKEAFSQFTLSSDTLAESYRALREEVHHLKEALHESQLEKERLREEAERNHRLAVVGEMAARMAHELRNPLGSIELFSSLLQKEVAVHTIDPEKQDWGKHLSSAVRTMDYAISNLLFYTGKPRPKYQWVEVDPLLSELLAFVSHLLQKNRIHTQIETTALLTPLWCDENLIKQALLNLITNAIEAMPNSGQLTIKAYTPESIGQDECVIDIQDTGPGISEKTLSHIFDPFFTTKSTGSGLGLAIAQNAIAAHKGQIRVDTRIGQGSCFTLRLPQKKE